MYNQSCSRQVKYSLDHLSKALFYLLQYKHIDEITVSELCQYAGITRKTFYRN